MSKKHSNDAKQLKGILEQFSLETISEVVSPLIPIQKISESNLVQVTIPITENIGYEVFSTLTNLAEANQLNSNLKKETNGINWKEIENQGDQALKKVNVSGKRKDKGATLLTVVTKDESGKIITQVASGRTSNDGNFSINFATDGGKVVCLRHLKKDISSYTVSPRTS